jgi:hypothetical protein
MNSTRYLCSFLTAAGLLISTSALLNAKDEENNQQGWISLFDGTTTTGWTPRVEVVSFEAVDGELHLLSEKNVWVTSDVKAANFVFEAEVLMPDDAEDSGFNSGLSFRCIGETGKPKGYQCEIDGPYPGQTGGIYGIGLGGWLYPTKDTAAEHKERITAALKRGEWNRYRIQCEGKRIMTWVNDTLISDIEDEQSLSGFFGIQHHGKGGVAKFRKLRMRDLEKATPSTR